MPAAPKQNKAKYWLTADNKTGEIARFEIGLKLAPRLAHQRRATSKAQHFPSDPRLTKVETDFDPNNMSSHPTRVTTLRSKLMPREQGTDRSRIR